MAKQGNLFAKRRKRRTVSKAVGLRSNCRTLKKGFRYIKGGKIVKAKAKR